MQFVFHRRWSGIANQYSNLVQARQPRDRIPVKARFSAPVQTSLQRHPAPIKWVRGHSQGVKQPGCVIHHPCPPSTKVKEGVEWYLYSPSVPSWQVKGWTSPYPLLHRKHEVLPMNVVQGNNYSLLSKSYTYHKHILWAKHKVFKSRCHTVNMMF